MKNKFSGCEFDLLLVVILIIGVVMALINNKNIEYED